MFGPILQINIAMTMMGNLKRDNGGFNALSMMADSGARE